MVLKTVRLAIYVNDGSNLVVVIVVLGLILVSCTMGDVLDDVFATVNVLLDGIADLDGSLGTDR